MGTMEVTVEKVTEEVQFTIECGCGSCHPTATIYRDDPGYEHHESRLAQGPCCCGRFFVVDGDAKIARERVDDMATQFQQDGLAPKGYEFKFFQVSLPWGDTVEAISANLRE